MSTEHESTHPSDFQYIKVAIALAIATAIEVGVFYMSSLRSIIAVILIPLMLVKFVLVVMWFMHLKFDSKLFRRVFVAGILFAIGVYSIALVTLIGYRP